MFRITGKSIFSTIIAAVLIGLLTAFAVSTPVWAQDGQTDYLNLAQKSGADWERMERDQSSPKTRFFVQIDGIRGNPNEIRISPKYLNAVITQVVIDSEVVLGPNANKAQFTRVFSENRTKNYQLSVTIKHLGQSYTDELIISVERSNKVLIPETTGRSFSVRTMDALVERSPNEVVQLMADTGILYEEALRRYLNSGFIQPTEIPSFRVFLAKTSETPLYYHYDLSLNGGWDAFFHKGDIYIDAGLAYQPRITTSVHELFHFFVTVLAGSNRIYLIEEAMASAMAVTLAPEEAYQPGSKEMSWLEKFFDPSSDISFETGWDRTNYKTYNLWPIFRAYWLQSQDDPAIAARKFISGFGNPTTIRGMLAMINAKCQLITSKDWPETHLDAFQAFITNENWDPAKPTAMDLPHRPISRSIDFNGSGMSQQISLPDFGGTRVIEINAGAHNPQINIGFNLGSLNVSSTDIAARIVVMEDGRLAWSKNLKVKTGGQLSTAITENQTAYLIFMGISDQLSLVPDGQNKTINLSLSAATMRTEGGGTVRSASRDSKGMIVTSPTMDGFPFIDSQGFAGMLTPAFIGEIFNRWDQEPLPVQLGNDQLTEEGTYAIADTGSGIYLSSPYGGFHEEGFVDDPRVMTLLENHGLLMPYGHAGYSMAGATAYDSDDQVVAEFLAIGIPGWRPNADCFPPATPETLENPETSCNITEDSYNVGRVAIINLTTNQLWVVGPGVAQDFHYNQFGQKVEAYAPEQGGYPDIFISGKWGAWNAFYDQRFGNFSIAALIHGRDPGMPLRDFPTVAVNYNWVFASVGYNNPPKVTQYNRWNLQIGPDLVPFGSSSDPGFGDVLVASDQFLAVAGQSTIWMFRNFQGNFIKWFWTSLPEGVEVRSMAMSKDSSVLIVMGSDGKFYQLPFSEWGLKLELVSTLVVNPGASLETPIRYTGGDTFEKVTVTISTEFRHLLGVEIKYQGGYWRLVTTQLKKVDIITIIEVLIRVENGNGLQDEKTVLVVLYPPSLHKPVYDENSWPWKEGSLLIPGDYNGDGSVDLADAILALQVSTGASTDTPVVANEVNGDGRIGMIDAIFILQKVSGIRP